MKLVVALSVSIASATQCSSDAAWCTADGKCAVIQVLVPGCIGEGCNANGKDQVCANCVYDMDTCKDLTRDQQCKDCTQSMKDSATVDKICEETASAREAEGVICTRAGALPFLNIVDMAKSVAIRTSKFYKTRSLSTLVAAVVAGDLVATLSTGLGPLTLFAPTNGAFARLPGDTLANLLKPQNKDQLVEILYYHVVIGQQIDLNDLQDEQVLQTAAGKSLVVNRTVIKEYERGSEVAQHVHLKINGNSLLCSDSFRDGAHCSSYVATNGVIHIMDGGVLLPTPTAAVQV